MDIIRRYLAEVYNELETIPVAGPAVESMAKVRCLLREAYQLAKAMEQPGDGPDTEEKGADEHGGG